MSYQTHYTAGGSSSGSGNNNNNRSRESPQVRFVTPETLARPSDHYRRSTHNNPYAPPERHRHTSVHDLARNFIRDPISTTLSGFSRVTNFVLPSPTEEFESIIDSIRQGTSATGSPARHRCDSQTDDHAMVEVSKLPPPALPPIPFSQPQSRLEPLTVAEFVEKYSTSSRQELMERVFKGGIKDHVLRRRLWPMILGLTDQNKPMDWTNLEDLYNQYSSQWKSILPDQETRFTAYRERKSIIERDVIRCDRNHPFYKEQENLEKLQNLLLTYVMYDFDTGYVQGMSDLAAPILYVYEGDVMKAFWCFVQVMKLIGQNFEMSQQTIKLQLDLLWKLIEVTDPCFAQYLARKESKNCYFAFRWIVCQFKREFMKEKDDDYDDCLTVWESIWCAEHVFREVLRQVSTDDSAPNEDMQTESNGEGDTSTPKTAPKVASTSSPSSSPDKQMLKDVELYVLSISLAIIRRERDLILANEMGACDILKHFNTLKLNVELNSILHHAANIWFWLKKDMGEMLIYKEDEELGGSGERGGPTGDQNGIDDFDLLNDEEYLIVNGSAI